MIDNERWITCLKMSRPVGFKVQKLTAGLWTPVHSDHRVNHDRRINLAFCDHHGRL